MVANRVIDWDTIPLGQMSDADIAVEYGLIRTTVAGARRARGIPPFNDRGDKNRVKNIDWDEVPLGRAPDAYFAKKFGVHASVVNGARTRRGIARYPRLSNEERASRFAQDVQRWVAKVGVENVPPPIVEFMRWHGLIDESD
jgi:hypothetical protein